MKKPILNWSSLVTLTGLILLISMSIAGMRDPQLPVNFEIGKTKAVEVKPISVDLFSKSGGSGGNIRPKSSGQKQSANPTGKSRPRRVTAVPPRFTVPEISVPNINLEKAFILPAGAKFKVMDKPRNIKVPVRYDLIDLEEPIITEVVTENQVSDAVPETAEPEAEGPPGGTGIGGPSTGNGFGSGSGMGTEQLYFGQGEGRQPPPRYPREAERRGQEGSVTVEFEVDQNGYPQEVTVKKGSPWAILNREAQRVIKNRWKFAAGKPRRFQITIQFSLRK